MRKAPNTWHNFDYDDLSTHPSHKGYVLFVVRDQEFTGDGPYYSGDYLYDQFSRDDEKPVDQRSIVKWMRPDPKENNDDYN